MANEQIQAIEQDIAKAKVSVDFGAALERLKKNRDFKEVVLTGYFEKEAIRLVHLKAEPGMQTPEMQQSIVAQIDAIGAFSTYMNTALFKAARAGVVITEGEAAIVEIQSEELAGA